MNTKKVLFLAIHRPRRSPSQRYRIECYADYWQQNGFTLHQQYLISAADDAYMYAPGNLLPKVGILLKSALKRLYHVLTAHQYHLIIIQREAFMLGTAFFEYCARYCSKAKIIFDFDDAIWLPNVSEANRQWAFLKNPRKTETLLRLAHAVVVGNHYLAQYACIYNPRTIVIPSAIDLRQYQPTPKPTLPPNTPVCIGWSGSATTMPHFETALPALQSIEQKYANKVRFAVITNTPYHHPNLPVQSLLWNPETEAADIARFDIGIMPLPHNEWALGKCSMKGLQYMAMTVPAVLERIGANTEVIQEGKNGLLAAGTQEWVQQLSALIENPALRTQLGNQGRKTIEQGYAVQVLYHKWLSLFEQVLSQS
ncbi:MAG TPA: glycosyltransferase family 4 protein [Chitinophagales bacterium]|nr:glycosyltransferase family 4 protein [Chitinophagales bacterium]HRK25952.1 glycosyltransferase family 4 protein [Chitinophagales bacterium]